MWIYHQGTGQLYDPSGQLAGTGYSGHDQGKNNPAFQNVHDIGPIPAGTFEIGDVRDSEKLGPVVMPLKMTAGESYGRTGFYIHGDSIKDPGTASHGCVILPRPVRLKVSASQDRVLEVV